MTDQDLSATPAAAHLRVPGVAFLLAQPGFHSTGCGSTTIRSPSAP